MVFPMNFAGHRVCFSTPHVGTFSLRTMHTELSALATAAFSVPLRVLLPRAEFDPEAPHPTPVVLVHGLLGDPTNFLSLRSALRARGIRNLASFSYPPRLDYQRLVPRLRQTIEAVSAATGSARVDLVGHSLGGLVARYLAETGECRAVRRVVTLGAPYFGSRVPAEELAIFAANDPFIPAPHPVRGPHGLVCVVPDCGHLGLLYHPVVLREVAAFLSTPSILASARRRAAA